MGVSTSFDLSYFYSKTKGYLHLCLIKHHATQMYRGVEIKLYMFLSSARDGGEWSVLCHGHFTRGEKTLVPNGWKAGTAAQAVWTLHRKSKHLYCSKESNHDTLTAHPWPGHYTELSRPQIRLTQTTLKYHEVRNAAHCMPPRCALKPVQNPYLPI